MHFKPAPEEDSAALSWLLCCHHVAIFGNTASKACPSAGSSCFCVASNQGKCLSRINHESKISPGSGFRSFGTAFCVVTTLAKPVPQQACAAFERVFVIVYVATILPNTSQTGVIAGIRCITAVFCIVSCRNNPSTVSAIAGFPCIRVVITLPKAVPERIAAVPECCRT